jgi:hypothetical protein
MLHVGMPTSRIRKTRLRNSGVASDKGSNAANYVGVWEENSPGKWRTDEDECMNHVVFYMKDFQGSLWQQVVC